MGPLSFITNENDNRCYAQIDLAQVAEIDEEQLEDLMDLIIAEARKDDEKIKIEYLEHQLKAEGYL